MFDLSEVLEKNGHEVIPFSMQEARNFRSVYSPYFIKNLDYNKDNFSIAQKAYIALRSLYCFEAKNKIKKVIDLKKPQIAHIHNFNYHLTPSILGPLIKKRIPIIQTLHDYHIICPSHNLYDFCKMQICTDCKGKHFFNAAKKRCIKESFLKSLVGAIEGYLIKLLRVNSQKIDLFVSPSKFLRDRIIEYGIDSKKICHIPNFIDTDGIQPNLSNDNYFVYFGRLEKFKGVLTLVRAFREIKNSRLLILGRGSLNDVIQGIIEKDNLKNIRLLGFKKKRDLYRILTNCIATIIPSEWFENNPISALESFAFGKPVIGSNIGGLPEIIREGVTGYLFDAGNHRELTKKIQICLNNKSQMIDMGSEARQLVDRKFNPQRHYDKLFEKYRKLLA
jgi:glycosyltransferase involved in cell wall biosynthesis